MAHQRPDPCSYSDQNNRRKRKNMAQLSKRPGAGPCKKHMKTSLNTKKQASEMNLSSDSVLDRKMKRTPTWWTRRTQRRYQFGGPHHRESQVLSMAVWKHVRFSINQCAVSPPKRMNHRCTARFARGWAFLFPRSQSFSEFVFNNLYRHWASFSDLFQVGSRSGLVRWIKVWTASLRTAKRSPKKGGQMVITRSIGGGRFFGMGGPLNHAHVIGRHSTRCRSTWSVCVAYCISSRRLGGKSPEGRSAPASSSR